MEGVSQDFAQSTRLEDEWYAIIDSRSDGGLTLRVTLCDREK